jgi:hypothetical protein
VNLKEAKKLVMAHHHKMYLADWDGFWIEWRGNRLIYCGPKRTEDDVLLDDDADWITEELVHRKADEIDDALKELMVFHDAGYKLFPLVAEDKRPRDKGFQGIDYRPWVTGGGMRKWLAGGGNVGLLCGPDDIIWDIDPRNGGEESMEFLHCLGVTEFDVQDRPRVYSGRGDGGRHIYMKRPPDTPLKKPKWLTGIDMKTFGQLVVAAGSRHVTTGGLYTLKGNIAQARLAPDDLIDLLRRPPAPPRSGDGGELTIEETKLLLSCLKAEDFGKDGPHHDEWLDIAMSVHDGTNGEGMPEWLDWCATDGAYGKDASTLNELRWESFEVGMLGGRTYKTLLRAVTRAGRPDIVAQIGKRYQHAAEDFADDWDDELMKDIE